MTPPAQPIPELSDLETWRTLASANLAQQFEHISRGLSKRWMRLDGVWSADTGLPAAYPNSATLLSPLAETDAGIVVERLDQFYAQDAGSVWMLWSAWPTPDLARFGMHAAGETPLMVRLPGPLSGVDAVRIVEVGNESALRDYDEVMIHGYPIPELHFPQDRISTARGLGGPMRYFVGYEGDVPVSCATSCIGERELGIYSVATLPGKRGKGYGRALTLAALASAPHLPAVLEASESGFSVYRGLGFVQVGVFTLWYKPRPPRHNTPDSGQRSDHTT